MHIAVIESKLDGRGGSQRQALSFALAFQKLGHRVTVYTMAYAPERCFPELVRELKVIALPSGAIRKGRSIPFFGALNYILRSHEETCHARILAGLIDPATEILNPHDRLAFRVVALYKKEHKNIPSVLMMSDILTRSWIAWRRAEFDSHYRLTGLKKLFFRLLDEYEVRRFIKPHEGMMVLDTRTRDWAKKYFHKNAVIVRSGVDVEHFPYRERAAPRRDSIKLLVAGVFFLHRRYEDAIEAVSLLRKNGYGASLTIVGGNGGNEEYRGYCARLTALVRKRGVADAVSFPGHVSEEELISHYRTSHIYISPNHLQSWGLAVFEAMATGLPVIVSKTAGASEVLTD
ncbi:MAG: glycosyltransferase family 4 protein, partial [bacterium]|nr:glycosyltransferase family 4 protein [bacterium]